VKKAVAFVAVTLAFAAGAAGRDAWRFVTIRQQQVAVFKPNQWSCANYGRRVDCQTGDAFPYAVLTSSARGVTVRVVMLKGGSGHVIRSRNRAGNPVWTFTAL
jgi:hypothetical protein